MSKFANAVMSTEPPRRRPMASILTGRSGIGKTHFCSTIPKVWIIPVEQGLEGASKDHAWGCFKDADNKAIQPLTLAEFKDAVKVFVERNRALPPAERYTHLAIDSLSGLEELINNETVGHEKIAHMDAKEFQTAYTAAMPRWTDMRNMFDKLRDQCGLHIWLIAHSAETKESTETGEQYTKWDLAMTGTGQKLVQLRTFWRKWAESVLFIDWDATVTKGSIGKKQVGKYNARVLRTRETPNHYAKNRYGMPPIVPATWQDLERAIKAGLPATQDRTVKQLEAILPHLPPAEQASVRADMKAAKTPTAMVSVLSRAQGIMSVLASEQDDEPTEGQKPDAKPESFLDEPASEPDHVPADVDFSEPEPVNEQPAQPEVVFDDSEIDRLVVEFDATETREQHDKAMARARDLKPTMTPEQRTAVAAAADRSNKRTKSAA